MRGPARAGWLLIAAGLLVHSGCEGCREEDAPPPVRQEAIDPPARSAPPPSKVFAPQGDERGGGGGRRVLSAFVPDHPMGSEDRHRARRLIYRVSLLVPEAFGPKRRHRSKPSTELVVDASADRLRARFEGMGWPVAHGAEVRIRRDQPGVYVFDARGGRPLGPGQMAPWFEGGRVRRDPAVRVQPPDPDEQVGPGELLCRLLAEWGSHPTDTLERRCGDGGSVPAFRLGPWRADRTADVAVELPWDALRADHRAPPDPRPTADADGRSPVSRSALQGVEPFFPIPADPPGGHALEVHNPGRARALVVNEGVPVGWVDADTTARFGPLTAGMYRVGAMRPLGGAVMRSERVRVPGEVELGW